MYQKMCFVGVSVWNDKKINGSHILPLKRTEEGNRGGCVLLSGIQYRKMMELMLGTEASFLLKYVFIMRAMTQGEKEA